MLEPSNFKTLAICFESFLKCSKSNIKDRMPNGYIHPGWDIDIYVPLAILNYKLNIKTNWSCQGNHSTGVSRAYILLLSDFSFPNELLDIINSSKLYHENSDCFDSQGLLIPNKQRQIIHSTNLKMELSNYNKIYTSNQFFINCLNQWSKNEIIDLSKNKVFLDIINYKNHKNKLLFPECKDYFDVINNIGQLEL